MLRATLQAAAAARAGAASTVLGAHSSAAVAVSATRSLASSSGTDGEKLFDKILIANRGEIACRVIRTARKLGIKTVAVYSEPDSESLHVRLADEAVCVGPAASSESYLRMDKILDACKSTGAQAVHPGYGFLSENCEFARLLADNGIAFIGPNVRAIEDMGDKIESKKLAAAAGVSTIPGFVGVIEDEAHALRVANEIGYPVMIKASAGGGGKGMRIAWNDEEAVEGYRLSKDESAKSFGDDRLLVEKFIDNPRHIEIQILADSHGNTVYLNERECSIQRRNQKVVEEAPSPFIDPETRRKMGEQAIQLSKAVEYQSSGTVEFLVDSAKNFYFLEMNTRLQVEHPVTEFITGVDLVEQMIRVAAGHKLTFGQQDVQLKGWATESRVYAEDPLRNFLPSIGTLKKYKEPVLPPGTPDEYVVRCDSGIVEGSEISVHYDPLICKLITYAPDRQASIDLMKTALDSYVIEGVTHNINFLRDVMEHPRYVTGNISTKFIEEEFPEGYHGHQLSEEEEAQLMRVAAVLSLKQQHQDSTIDGKLDSFQPPAESTFVVRVAGGEARKVHVACDPDLWDYEFSVDIDGNPAPPVRADWPADAPVVHDESTVIQVARRRPFGYQLLFAGTKFDVDVRSEKQDALSQFMPVVVPIDTSKMLLSPMPGNVVSIAVKPGDKVVPGQELAVVEAMKMQNVLRAQADGVVKAVPANIGASVVLDEILVEFQ